MSRRLLALTVAVLMLCTLFVGFTNTTAIAAQKTTVTYDGDVSVQGFTPVADKGADYTVSGTVKIAVDTVRPTDYQAMFEVMKQLYPNVDITIDKWAHATNDDGREYLVKNMKTGTAADIMWDEAGEMPYYIKEGWVRAITRYVNADPEAINIPANLKADYTFDGALFALPHQATFELVAVNATLYEQLGGKVSDLEQYRNHPMSWEQYCALLQMGADGFEKGLCVAVQDLFETHNRYAWYLGSDSPKRYSALGFNLDTYRYEDELFRAGAKELRRLREIPGVEGWYESLKGTLKTNLNHASPYNTLWKTGKSLVVGTKTDYVDKWGDLGFKCVTMPTPSKNGNLMMQVDHCFITTNCSDENMPAAFQLLRFMTYSTNGNLARLSMFETENAKKFNLNSHIYYPTTNSQAVIDKFGTLEVANATDRYLLANLKNSRRYDAFKIVADYRANRETAKISTALNNVTDGKDTSASGLTEPIAKFNQLSVQSQKDFITAYETMKAEKAALAKPSAPVIERIGGTTISVKPTAGYEYSLDGTTWQESSVFTNLSPDTSYTIYQRVAELSVGGASDTSDSVTVRTDKAAPGESLIFENGVWYYTMDGVKTNATTLVNYFGTWYYVENGVVNFDATTLFNYYGTWYYINGGVLDWSATTLVNYYGTWYYVEGGVLNWGATTLVNYYGTWYYVEGGVLNWGATTLVNFYGTWYYVEGGVLNWGATTLVNYYGTWYYVEGGILNWGATTLCNYGGTWYYIEGGVLNWGATTLVNYYGTWYYIEGGVLNWNANLYFNYWGTYYRVVNGVVVF